MRSNLLLRRDAITVDRLRIQEAVEIIGLIVRCSADELKPDTVLRLVRVKSTLEDVFHELTRVNEELTSELLYGS